MLRKQGMQTFRQLDPYADIDEDITKLRGPGYHEIFQKVRRIIHHQFSKRLKKGIRGFLFWGDVGVGKTAMAKALAKDLGCPLIFVDGSDIARARYGESEQAITEIFKNSAGERRIILIDDAESVFPRRDWVKGESWHVAQNNVFFHELDHLDTSNTVVILTTNEIGLMDKAVKDRLFAIEFPLLPMQTLIEIAKDRCEELLLPWEDVVARIEKEPANIKSIRDVERIVLGYYAEGVR